MTLNEIQTRLRALEVRPSKGLGQNFLHDQNLARWFVDRLEAQPGDLLVEIGPGLGSLTEVIEKTGVRALAIERDSRLATFLAERYAGGSVEIRHEDATRFDVRELWGKGRVKVIGNLPYSVSTPLIDRFTSALSPACLLVLGLQKELADRLGAGPGTSDYGAMTVRLQRRWNIRVVKRLPASVFLPRPNVESAIVEMRPRLRGEFPPCDAELFGELVRRGFSERRKQFHKLLGPYRSAWPAAAERLGVPETTRAEALSVAQWIDLTNLLGPLPTAQKDEEIFPWVDEEDRVIGERPRREVHVNNLRHRAVHMLIFNTSGELFLQKRSPWKDMSPSLWDSSAAGHVDAGEEYDAAAVREIREELGVDVNLEPLFKLPSIPATAWEFIQVYRGVHDGPFQLAPAEIETGAFFPVARVLEWAAASPEDFTPVCRLVLDWLRAQPIPVHGVSSPS